VGKLEVALVAADRPIWSGDADLVIARTLDGDLGVLPGHIPVFAVLADGVVTIRRTEGDVVAAAHGGFLSVERDRVSILAESAELAHEIDVPRAEAALQQAKADAEATGESDEGASSVADALQRAETRLRAAMTPNGGRS
jgi:F-type H+-transporting ATPase subunit epsilon